MSEIDEAKRLRYEQLNEIASEDKVYIVFKGKPSVWYDHNDPALINYSALKNAEEEATHKAEEDQSEYTVMVVPKASVEIALVAKYHGVVIHCLDELDNEED
jgi:hypothetical protein